MRGRDRPRPAAVLMLTRDTGHGGFLTLGGNYWMVISELGGRSHRENRFFFPERNHFLLHYAAVVIRSDYCVFFKL